MRTFALATLLLALAAPVASGLGVDVAVTADPRLPVEAPPAPLGSEAATGLLPASLPPDLPAGLGIDVDATADLPVGRASVDVSPHADDAAAAGAGIPRVPAPIAEVAPPALAAAGLLALLQAFGGLRALALAGFAPLYSRLARSELLDNGHRDAIHRLVQENPGLALTEICKRAGLGWGTTVYHLDRLERAHMLASERIGLHRCYFPSGTVPRQTRQGIGALKADTTRAIATYLATRPGATQTELCESLGLNPSAASKQVTKLEAAGLVRRERDGKTVRLHATERLAPLLPDAPAPAAHALATAACARPAAATA